MSASALSIEDAIDRRVAQLEEPREPDGWWHPSEISGCLRRAVYRMQGVGETDDVISARTRRIFRIGHLLHEFIQSAVPDHPAIDTAYAEVKIELPDLAVRGSVDGLVRLADGEWEVEEYKTINSVAFKYNDLPKPGHVLQACTYVLALREYGGRTANGQEIPPLHDGLTRARIVYVSKDDMRIEEPIVFFTPARERDIRERVAILEAHRDNGLPPRLPLESSKKGESKRPWECGYCPYARRCWVIDAQ